jgi:hypothetical protein
MEASSVEQREYGGKGRWVTYWTRVGVDVMDFTMLRPDLVWWAFWNLWNVYFFNFKIVFRAAVNRGYCLIGYGATIVLTFSMKRNKLHFLEVMRHLWTDRRDVNLRYKWPSSAYKWLSHKTYNIAFWQTQLLAARVCLCYPTAKSCAPFSV